MFHGRGRDLTNIPRLIAANADRWKDVTITPNREREVRKVAIRLTLPVPKQAYEAISQQTLVPWFVIAVIHYRECGLNFMGNLANGDPWNHVTHHVPRGRGPFKSFHDAAVDALANCAPFAAKWKDWSAGGTLTLLELYNGVGYEDFHHESSPYVWGATNHEEWGKYVADGHWSSHVWDTQIGCAALLKSMMELDPSIKFSE